MYGQIKINMMIVNKIEELSRNIWINLHNAAKYNISFGEETITDFILLELAKQNYYQIKIIQTKKPSEALQGTDWEWFVGSGKFGWIRFSIQAKKHYINSDHYQIKYLVGDVPNRKYQYDILRAYAISNNSVPLYCFYNYFPNLDQKTHWHCGESFDAELLGWSFTTLFNIEKISSTYTKKNFNNIHTFQETLPMRCLFKCRYFEEKYMNTNFTTSQDFLGENFIKLETLPQSLITASEIGNLYEFPVELFNPDLKVYPKRIAIFDLTNLY